MERNDVPGFETASKMDVNLAGVDLVEPLDKNHCNTRPCSRQTCGTFWSVDQFVK
jgi:hypothetical protein